MDAAYAGQRAALNLTNLQKSEIRRGDAAVRPGSARSSRMLDVRLRCLRNAKRTVLNGSQVHLYHGTSVHLAKAVLLERDELRPGESCLAQLRLTEPMAVKQGDRFVIRFYSPVETIGGGTVLDPRPLRHKRHDLAVLDSLILREQGSGSQRLLQAAEEFGVSLPDSSQLAERSGLDTGTAVSLLADLLTLGPLPGIAVRLPPKAPPSRRDARRRAAAKAVPADHSR